MYLRNVVWGGGGNGGGVCDNHQTGSKDGHCYRFQVAEQGGRVAAAQDGHHVVSHIGCHLLHTSHALADSLHTALHR